MSNFTEFKPEYAGRPIHELPDGATGCKSRTVEQSLNEMADGGVTITEAEDFLAGIPKTYAFPRVVNPLDYLKVKDQKQKGACAGFTLATVGEMNFWVASGGEIERFSGDALYVLAQEKDGIRGDRGSTPTACAWVAQNIGLVPESVYGPTVSTYQQLKRVTSSMREAASDYKLKSIVRLKTYQHVKDFLGAGLGSVQCCSRWQQHFMHSNLVDSFFGPRHNSQHGGGHSYTLNGYDEAGNILVTNSWNTNVHDEGGFKMTPRCIKELFTDNFSFVLGYSNMQTSHATPPGPREIKLKHSDWV